MVEAENIAAANIAAETVEAVYLSCLSSTTTGLILRGIGVRELMMQDFLMRKSKSNFHRDFFVSMGVYLFFKKIVMKLCAITLVYKICMIRLPTKT